ncbi:MAG: hypothetical protein ACLQVD_10500 [Capsulimonadaceae bacterium]
MGESALAEPKRTSNGLWNDALGFGAIVFGHQLVARETEMIDVDAGPWGRVQFRVYGDWGDIRVGTSAGCEAVVNAPDDLWANSSAIPYVIDPVIGRLLLLNWAGRHVYEMLIERGQLHCIADLYRTDDDDPCLFRASFVEGHNDLLFVYENGIICFNGAGEIRWRHDHSGNTDWCFREIRDGAAVYSCPWENGWAYRLSDGERIPFLVE